MIFTFENNRYKVWREVNGRKVLMGSFKTEAEAYRFAGILA